MPQLPHDRLPDATIAFAFDGYEFISNRCRRYRSDVFETRLLLRPVICMRGPEAARVFYDTERFQRRGAMPARVVKTLLGRGGVQSLDGDAHRHRKDMLMSLMTPAAIDDLADRFAERWSAAIAQWARTDEVVLYDEAARLLCQAVCAWAGVPLAEDEVQQRTDDLAAMFDAAGAVGPRHWDGRRARNRTETWISDLIEQTRRGDQQAPDGSALNIMASHRDTGGQLLAARVAAVDLINLLRPTVAITHFIVFAALALHEHPGWRQQLRSGGDDELERFVQEVRRYYPFFPAAAARARQDFEWNGARFPAGRLVLLDLYGSNRHPGSWGEPDRFRPERFRSWDGDSFTLIPQGGGDHYTGHRCAGEWITIRLMKTAVDMLTRRMAYQVPHQDLHVSRSRLPARPRSGFVVRGVRATEDNV